MTLINILGFSALLFSLGLLGIVINRKNVITLLMSIELILLSVNTNLIAFARSANQIQGEVFVFFILTVAAAEAAIGLALVVVLFRQKRSIEVDGLRTLRG